MLPDSVCASVCTAEEHRWTDRLTVQQPDATHTHTNKQKSNNWALNPKVPSVGRGPDERLCDGTVAFLFDCWGVCLFFFAGLNPAGAFEASCSD